MGRISKSRKCLHMVEHLSFPRKRKSILDYQKSMIDSRFRGNDIVNFSFNKLGIYCPPYLCGAVLRTLFTIIIIHIHIKKLLSNKLILLTNYSISKSALSVATASPAVHVFLNTLLKPISLKRLSISGQFFSSSNGAATVPPT